MLRVRKVDGDDDDSTVKLRPVDPAALGEHWLAHDGLEIEMDRVGQREVVSAKLSEVQDRGEIDDAVGGRRALRKLFSQDQERLIADFGPAGVAWEQLTVMGPIGVSKWKIDVDRFEEAIVVERWQLPDGSDLVELSTKSEPQHASSTAEDFRTHLRELGLAIDGDQQTKTKGRAGLLHHRRGLRLSDGPTERRR